MPFASARMPIKPGRVGNVFLLPTMTLVVTLSILVFQPRGGQRGAMPTLPGTAIKLRADTPVCPDKILGKTRM